MLTISFARCCSGVPKDTPLTLVGQEVTTGLNDDEATDASHFHPHTVSQVNRNTFYLSAPSPRSRTASVSSTGAGEPAKRRYRRHPKVDPHAPVKPASAYVEFSNVIREEMKGASFTEIARRVGERWQALSKQEKEVRLAVYIRSWHSRLTAYILPAPREQGSSREGSIFPGFCGLQGHARIRRVPAISHRVQEEVPVGTLTGRWLSSGQRSHCRCLLTDTVFCFNHAQSIRILPRGSQCCSSRLGLVQYAIPRGWFRTCGGFEIIQASPISIEFHRPGRLVGRHLEQQR